MKLFIGSGHKFLTEEISLSFKDEDDYEKFKDKNKNLYFFKVDHLFDDYPIFFILYKEAEIIGVIKVQKSMFATNSHPFWGLNYVCIKEGYHGLGLCRQLYEALFSYFQDGFVLSTDYENQEVKNKLTRLSYSLAKKYGVYFLTREDLFQFEEDLPSTKLELYSKLPGYFSLVS